MILGFIDHVFQKLAYVQKRSKYFSKVIKNE